MASPKRFIAGAICPRCAEMDKIMMFTKDNDEQVRECVACGFTDALSEQEQPENPELQTRVNTRGNEMITRLSRWCFSRLGLRTEL